MPMNEKYMKPRKSLISIADVLKTGRRMSTESEGILKYRVPDMEIAVSAVPATHQGGDFYGIVYQGHRRTAIFIGDVAGHDFSSTIPATEAISFFDENREDLVHPHIFLKNLNNRMYPLLNSVGRFLTVAVCLLDVENNLISYASAGHPPMLKYNPGGGRVKTVGERMLPIGFEEDLNFKLIQVEFLPGDSLVFYTDGLTSVRNGSKEEFGIQRIKRLLEFSGKNPQETIKKLLEEYEEFCRGGADSDDCTIICALRTS